MKRASKHLPTPAQQLAWWLGAAALRPGSGATRGPVLRGVPRKVPVPVRCRNDADWAKGARAPFKAGASSAVGAGDVLAFARKARALAALALGESSQTCSTAACSASVPFLCSGSPASSSVRERHRCQPQPESVYASTISSHGFSEVSTALTVAGSAKRQQKRASITGAL